MGKDAGDDFRDGKVTLPVILAYARANETDKEFLREAIEGLRNEDEDLARAIRILRDTGALADTAARARHYSQRAVDTLASFPNSLAKSALIEAAQFAVARAY
jgi:octaprenyl-diphosphate synthase